MGTYIGRGTWHHLGSVVNGLAKFLCGISQDGSSCDSLLHWLQDNIISQSQISSMIFSTNQKNRVWNVWWAIFWVTRLRLLCRWTARVFVTPVGNATGVDEHPAWCCRFFCFSVLLRPVHRCRHCQSEAHQPHRKKCVFQSQDDCTSQILRAP